MTSLIPIIQHLILGNMAERTTVPRFSSVKIILRTLSLILLLAGLFLAIYAEYMWLGIFLPSYLAALITSLTLIILSIGIGFFGGIFNHKKSEQSHSSPADISSLLTEILSSLDEDLESTIRANPKMAVILSSLGGFMAGKK
jgi:cytochrome c biogenesis protein CcdA